MIPILFFGSPLCMDFYFFYTSLIQRSELYTQSPRVNIMSMYESEPAGGALIWNSDRFSLKFSFQLDVLHVNRCGLPAVNAKIDTTRISDGEAWRDTSELCRALLLQPLSLTWMAAIQSSWRGTSVPLPFYVLWNWSVTLNCVSFCNPQFGNHCIRCLTVSAY